jgi:hypothetical protein
MCLNKKVLIGLGVVAVGLVVLRPGWALPALPFLILAVCPLSMIFMMRGMSGRNAEAAGSRPGAQPESASASPATTADLGEQITGVHSHPRVLE